MDPRGKIQICTVCCEDVIKKERPVSTLMCNHKFHLDCIAAAFNASNKMECPNCRMMQRGEWKYGTGPLSNHYELQFDHPLDEWFEEEEDEEDSLYDIVGIEEDEESFTFPEQDIPNPFFQNNAYEPSTWANYNAHATHDDPIESQLHWSDFASRSESESHISLCSEPEDEEIVQIEDQEEEEEEQGIMDEVWHRCLNEEWEKRSMEEHVSSSSEGEPEDEEDGIALLDQFQKQERYSRELDRVFDTEFAKDTSDSEHEYFEEEGPGIEHNPRQIELEEELALDEALSGDTDWRASQQYISEELYNCYRASRTNLPSLSIPSTSSYTSTTPYYSYHQRQ